MPEIWSIGVTCQLVDLLPAVYVPADDMTDPAPVTTFIYLDATTVLSSSLALRLYLYGWALGLRHR